MITRKILRIEGEFRFLTLDNTCFHRLKRNYSAYKNFGFEFHGCVLFTFNHIAHFLNKVISLNVFWKR